MADGDTMLYVLAEGSNLPFRCTCGANIFKKNVVETKGSILVIYTCNGCGKFYVDSDKATAEAIREWATLYSVSG